MSTAKEVMLSQEINARARDYFSATYKGSERKKPESP
jgi:hypothetical protein